MQDIEYLKSMYPSGIKILQGYVSEACDRLDYKNSPMYDEYPDHLMINRLCDSIYNTVISSEGPERVQSMWNITEADKSALEMAELKKDMQRLDIIPDYSDQGPDNNMVKAQDHNSEHIAESTSVRAVNTGGNGSRSSLLKNSNEFDNGFNVHSLEEKMEIQEMRGKEMARTQGGRPPMGPGQGQERPPMGPGPERPPMGPGQGQGRPPMGPGQGQERPPMGPGPERPPMGPGQGQGRPPMGPGQGQGRPPMGPGPERPPMGPGQGQGRPPMGPGQGQGRPPMGPGQGQGRPPMGPGQGQGRPPMGPGQGQGRPPMGPG
ncbi:hypothetical protein AAAU98_26960, partial [Enterocloster citroniae]|uniref:hypothetical protein n=1 Tax=Enterocloster citroniae TaxID=358743 RepID=UPI0032BF8143